MQPTGQPVPGSRLDKNRLQAVIIVLLAIIVLLLGGLLLAQCGDDTTDANDQQAEPTQDDTAVVTTEPPTTTAVTETPTTTPVQEITAVDCDAVDGILGLLWNDWAATADDAPAFGSFSSDLPNGQIRVTAYDPSTRLLAAIWEFNDPQGDGLAQGIVWLDGEIIGDVYYLDGVDPIVNGDSELLETRGLLSFELGMDGGKAIANGCSPSSVTVADTLRDAGCIFAADTGYWDCQGPDFKGVDLSGADLEGADLAGAILFSVNFTGATLKDADLTGARGLGADFSDADLTGAALGAGEWTSASFVGADLAGADLSSAHLDQVDFTNANLTGAELSGRFLPGVIFVGTDLRNVDLSGAHLSGADFTNANLTGADLSRAHLGETDYTAGEFFTDNWPGPGYLGPATFVNADLTNATVCPIQNLHVAFPLGSSELVADGTTCLLDTLPLPGLVVFASPWFDGSDDEPEPLWQAGESECEWRSADLADGHWSRRYGCMTEFKIYVMSPDGSGLRRLNSVDYVDHYSPVWSPDGTRIAFISWHPEGSSEIHVMNADGTGVEQLTNGGGSVSWSPDGTRIAFIRVVEGASQIHVINADGTGIEQLTDDNGSFSNPAWSPDGTQIAAAWDREGHDLALVRMNADGSGLGLLKPTGSVGDDWQESPGSLAWSPDGGLIIHEIGADKTEIVISGLSGAWASTGVYGRSPDWID